MLLYFFFFFFSFIFFSLSICFLCFSFLVALIVSFRFSVSQNVYVVPVRIQHDDMASHCPGSLSYSVYKQCCCCCCCCCCCSFLFPARSFPSVGHLACGGGTGDCFSQFLPSFFSISLSIHLLCFCFLFDCFFSFIYLIDCVCRACRI